MVDENDAVQGKSRRKVAVVAGMIAVLVILLLLVMWIFQREPEVETTTSTPGLPQETLPQVPLEPESEPEPAPEPPPSEPVEPEEPEEPLPALGRSDQPLREDLQQLPEASGFVPLLTRDDVIRKSVRAVTALQENALVNKYRPIAPPQEAFHAEPLDEPQDPDEPQKYRLTGENYQRYEGYIDVLSQLDSESLMGLYERYYPLLQEAYLEQGMGDGEFREVTLKAIDNLLAAPVIEDEILLVRPSVAYKFADPQLEALPAAQKLMVRMGPDNSRKLKNVLRRFRTELEQ